MKERIPVKISPDGRALLNLGCGTRMHPAWNNLDNSPYSILGKHKNVSRFLYKVRVISEERWKNISKIDPDIIHWDLMKGIPFSDEVFDAVFSSHVLEHFEKDFARGFLRECYRVLQRGGIIRIVVPCLESIIERYREVIRRIDADREDAYREHNEVMDDLFGQMIREVPFGTSLQPKAIRVLENVIRGGMDKRGELHKWMYDRHSLGSLLKESGFTQVERRKYNTSSIDRWYEFSLDMDDDGTPYKPGSLYMEAIK